MTTTHAVAVIPARGGSKRIPRKNVRTMSGRPLIAWAIETALQSEQFEVVVVSTDDDEIAAIAETNGALVPFRRPAELSDDFAPTIPVIGHAVQALRGLGYAVDEACSIYPGAVFVTPDDLVAARRLMHETRGAAYALAVAQYAHPIQRALGIDEHGLARPVEPQYALTRTQDLEPRYFDAGQFCWGVAQAWVDGTPVHGTSAGYVLDAHKVVDIDTEDDWLHAERLHALRPR